MSRLALKLLLLLLPLLLFGGLYVLLDPFEVARHYERYYREPRVMYNRDHHSAEIFLNNYPQYRYDSFIFGSSRTLAFLTREWAPCIKGGKAFHFDSHGETLYGIHAKARFLDRRGVRIRNCLILIDADNTLTGIRNRSGHLYVVHPAVSQEGWLHFQLASLKAFSHPRYLAGYLEYRLKGRVHPLFSDLFDESDWKHDPVTNDEVAVGPEQEILHDPSGYYRKRADLFAGYTAARQADPAVGEAQEVLLVDLKQIFDRHGTDYRIVVAPLYSGLTIDSRDLMKLRWIFGEGTVFDYSGDTRFIRNRFNFYDENHFRPQVAREILREIYKCTATGGP